MELAEMALQSKINGKLWRRCPRERHRNTGRARWTSQGGGLLIEKVLLQSKEDLAWMTKGLAEALWANQTFQQRQYSEPSDLLPQAEKIFASLFDSKGKPLIPCDVATSHIVGEGRVGFSLVAQMPNALTGDPETRIVCIYVEKEHRGKGVGKMNLKCCLDWARERGLSEVTAEVGAANPAALRLFREAGMLCVSQTMSREVGAETASIN